MKAGEDLPLALGLLHLDSNVPDRASLIFFFWTCVEILESVLIDWVQIWRDFAPISSDISFSFFLWSESHLCYLAAFHLSGFHLSSMFAAHTSVHPAALG